MKVEKKSKCLSKFSNLKIVDLNNFNVNNINDLNWIVHFF